MNIHPIFVHFPIAFLTLYSILELARFKKIKNQPYWFYVKAVLVIAGSLGTLAALQTGDMSAYLIRGDAYLRPVLSMHENFADLTTLFFGILAGSYFVAWLNRDWYKAAAAQNVLWKFFTKISNLVLNTPAVVILAVLGLVCVTITGGLGGSMVFGANADPFFKPIFNLLIKQ